MHEPGDQYGLSSADRRLLVGLVERYERAREQDDQPSIERLLPEDDPPRTALLIELVHVELEHRLTSGEPARVEECLHRFPELKTDNALVKGPHRYQMRLDINDSRSWAAGWGSR